MNLDLLLCTVNASKIIEVRVDQDTVEDLVFALLQIQADRRICYEH